MKFWGTIRPWKLIFGPDTVNSDVNCIQHLWPLVIYDITLGKHVGRIK